MHEALRPQQEIKPLRSPLLLAAFRGWNDSTGSAVSTLRFLRERWGATELAEIDPDPFYDFTAQRPYVRMRGDERIIRWPTGRFYVASPEGAEHDFVLLSGREPSLRWQLFTEVVEDLMRSVGAERCLTLGARPAAVPHTRPPIVTLSNADPEFQRDFGLESRTTTYQGPTGIFSALSVHLNGLGWHTGQLSALVPHYLAGPNPNAMMALVRTLDRAFGTKTSLQPLDDRIKEFENAARTALEQAENKAEAAGYLRRLEEQYDANPPAGSTFDAEPSDLPSSADLLEDLDDFLRQRREPGD